MRTFLRIVPAALFALALVGCSVSKDQLRQTLKENPDIVLDALAAQPVKTMESLQKLSQEARKQGAEKEEQEMKKAMDDELKSPKKVTLSKDRALRGNADAPIFLVEYSDFQCPFCKRGFETVENVRKKYGDKVSFVFKHLPLPFHPMAMPAAKRFEAIALQSPEKAFQFHDEVFQNQQNLSNDGEKYMDGVAKKLGVNVAKMKKDMDSDKVKSRIEADMKEANELDFTGTPGFVVSGVRIRGAMPPDVFEKIIDQRLKEGKGPTASAAISENKGT